MPGLWLQEVWRQVFPPQVLTLLSLMAAAPEAEPEAEPEPGADPH